ncbi:MAG TPA: transposase [Nitrososphaerales archaeon]|nr:transposase [Nitrososphaerales archaeon]
MKCVTQQHSSEQIGSLLAKCLNVTYNAIHYAKEYGIDNRKGMKGFYQTLKEIKLPSCYKVASITRACAVVQSRKKGERRGIKVSHPRPLKPAVCIASGFFVTMKGRLFVPLRRDEYFDVQLNHHVIQTLKGKEVRSLTITPNSLSFCYSEDVEQAPVKTVYGVDMNEKNLTFGDASMVVQIDMTKTVRLRQATREILGSCKRDDVRVRRRLASKYWKRAKQRTDQILHAATNLIVDSAAKHGAALALEDLTGIRKMYYRGNHQGADYRFRLNSWPQWKSKRMIGYKAAWNGGTIIQLTKSETYGSSSTCPTCGEKLHSPARDDVKRARMLWCQKCKVWRDRDLIAVLNLSKRGLSRFASSRPRPGEEESSSQASASSLETGEEGLAGEAVKGNGTRKTLILRVDASKLTRRREPKS